MLVYVLKAHLHPHKRAQGDNSRSETPHNTHQHLLDQGVTAQGYETHYGMPGNCILGLHGTYCEVLGEGTKGEEREGSRLLGV